MAFIKPPGLEGNVAAADSGDPSAGAQVEAGAQSAFTDAGGDYGFAAIPVGTYDVTASAPTPVSCGR